MRAGGPDRGRRGEVPGVTYGWAACSGSRYVRCGGLVGNKEQHPEADRTLERRLMALVPRAVELWVYSHRPAVEATQYVWLVFRAS